MPAISAFTTYVPATVGTSELYVLSSAPLSLYLYVTVSFSAFPLTDGVFGSSPYVQFSIDTVGVIPALSIATGRIPSGELI